MALCSTEQKTNRAAVLTPCGIDGNFAAWLGSACRQRRRCQNLRSSIGGYITIQTAVDSEQNTDEVLLQQLSTLDNVSKYNGVDPYYMYTEGLELIPGSYRGTGMVGEFVPKFVACTDSSLHERFVGASFLLAEGRHITEDDLHKAMVSQELAQRNRLSLGDTIHASVVEGVAGWQPEQYGTEVDFEIVGIYQIARNEPSDPTTPESELQGYQHRKGTVRPEIPGSSGRELCLQFRHLPVSGRSCADGTDCY